MKLIINIPDELYNQLCEDHSYNSAKIAYRELMNGKPYEERPEGEPPDNKMTTLVTLSDGWDHVREAYYDKGRQLVFTEWFSVKDLDSRFININERKELSDSEVKDGGKDG